MSIFKIGVAVIVLAAALSIPAYAANKGGGGGGHGGGGGGGHAAGGGGGHGGGGGGGHGGGGHAAGGGGRGGGARVSGGGGYRGGGGAHVGARSAISRSAAGPTSRGNVERPIPGSTSLRAIKTSAVRNTLNSRSVAATLRDSRALRNSRTRANITAIVATAAWHNGRDGEHGWWRHGNGGYGWVGPLYWPFAYYDMYDYAMWGGGYDDSFWGYGYGDIYAGLFAPYDYDELTGYLPQYASANPGSPAPASPETPSAATDQLAQMCGQDSHDIAGLPIDQFEKTIQPTDAQRAALDDLANASIKAAQGIKATCPTDIALTAPRRLAAMQRRIEAMIAAVEVMQSPLEKFYDLLSDEQKARLTALANDQRQNKTAAKPTSSLAQSCGAAQPGVMEWPTADIGRTVQPTEAQRASLVALEAASTKAADMLKASCPTDNPLTPPLRLAAIGQRLDAILGAVKTVRSALNDFYGMLTDEQKAKFEAIGPLRTSQAEALEVAPTDVRRRGPPGVEQIIRRLIPIGF